MSKKSKNIISKSPNGWWDMPQVKQIEGVGKISGSGSKKVIACLLQI